MKFIFDDFYFKENKLYLHYCYDNNVDFLETIEFPNDKELNDDDELNALNNVFKYIHIVCGISYYKLFCPEEIVIKNFSINKEEADFFNDFYYNGLGEFLFKNDIKNLKINFPYDDTSNNNASEIALNKKYLIPIGGGKDSIVTLDILKNEDIITCSIGKATSIDNIIKVSKKKSFHPIRTISKNLLELNKNLDIINGYNGHVPISGILAFIMAACSIIYGFDTILMSNERSANYGNTEFLGKIVNHQWSKSFEFEKNINLFFKKYVLKNLNYVSFLRPLSELYIAKIFSNLKEYHSIFTSCNKNFKIENRLNHWCCDCDKCRFVFLILSVFLDKKSMINIFGKNLLDDKNQLEGYKELCGLTKYKPFECVGEIDESIYSVLNINKDFENDFIIKELRLNLKDKDFLKNKKNNFFELSNEHILDDKLLNILNNYINNLK